MNNAQRTMMIITHPISSYVCTRGGKKVGACVGVHYSVNLISGSV